MRNLPDSNVESLYLRHARLYHCFECDGCGAAISLRESASEEDSTELAARAEDFGWVEYSLGWLCAGCAEEQGLFDA